jgi:cytochrome c oxidase subunit 2
MVILLFIAFPSLYILYLTEDSCISGCIIKVIGHQWYWEYQYSGAFGDFEFNSYMLTSGDLIYRNLDVDNRVLVPTLVPSLFMVTSSDVLHSW